MNRLTTKIAAVALAVLVLGTVSVQAKEKKPKHKKHEDLSANPLAGVNSKQPDKELFDKAMVAMKKGRFDVARLDLQTMLNTYPDSEYRMRAAIRKTERGAGKEPSHCPTKLPQRLPAR